MTSAPGEITPRQLVEAMVKAMRTEITVRRGQHNELIVEGFPPPVDTRFTLRAIITPPGTP